MKEDIVFVNNTVSNSDLVFAFENLDEVDIELGISFGERVHCVC